MQWRVNFIQQLAANLVDEPRSSIALPKAKLTSKEGQGHCLGVCCLSDHCSFLNPCRTITSEKYAQQINETHWKLQCPQPALVNRKGPMLLHDNSRPHITQPTLQTLNKSGRRSFASSAIFTWPLIYRLPLLRASWLFLQGNASTISKRQKMLSKSSSNPEAWMFMLQE